MTVESEVQPDGRVATAAHEVGHALLASLFQFEVKSISISNFLWLGHYSGRVKLKDKWAYIEDCDLLCTFYLGGQEAQALYLQRVGGYSLPEARILGRSAPDTRAARAIMSYTDSSKEEILRRADRILLSRWPQVMVLSEKLAERKRLATQAVKAQSIASTKNTSKNTGLQSSDIRHANKTDPQENVNDNAA